MLHWSSAYHVLVPIARLKAKAIADLATLNHAVTVLLLTLVPEDYEAYLRVDAEFILDRAISLLNLAVGLEHLLVEHVLAEVQRPPVADRALPALMLCVHLDVRLKIEALQMQAMLTACRLLDRHVRERARRVQSNHGRLLRLLNRYIVVHLLLALEKLLGPGERGTWILNTIDADVVEQHGRLYHPDKEDRANLPRLLEKSLVVLLLLKDVEAVLATVDLLRDVLHLVFSFLLVVWRVWCSVLLRIGVVKGRLPVLGVTMLKTDTIQAQAAHLNSQSAPRPKIRALVDLAIPVLLHHKLFARVRLALVGLDLSTGQLVDQKRS